ncbi:MAG: hypothetical protein Q4A29_01540 [Eubacteriales bacterium]|nr:hypothetical protein [Eubacteriales bacterium]
MTNFLEKTLEVDLFRRYQDVWIASIRQFKEEAVILDDDKTSVTFLIRKEDRTFLGYADGVKPMELIPLNDSIMQTLINAYGKGAKNG